MTSLDSQGKATSEWITTTPEGYYDGSKNAAASIRWRVDGKLLPASELEGTYHRPDKVAAALAK